MAIPEGIPTTEEARSRLDAMLRGRNLPNKADPFGLRSFNFRERRAEKSELFGEAEAITYIAGCDYPESVDDLLLALEIQRMFGTAGIAQMSILDAMCGPGRLGREFLGLGVQSVAFHDGDQTMTTHAQEQTTSVLRAGQCMDFITSPVANIPVADNTFNLVVCHNSTHQLSDTEKLEGAIGEFLRITAPLGYVVIADYQRSTTPGFFQALEERLRYTKPEIVPLLIPSFFAAFSKREFVNVLGSIAGIRRCIVSDAEPPELTPKLWERVQADPVKGHLMDYSSVSLRVVVQKEET